jgi:hypothetical protein
MTSASSRWPACGRPARRSPGKRASASIVAPVSPGSAALSSPAASRLLPVRQDLPFPAELTDEHRDDQRATPLANGGDRLQPHPGHQAANARVRLTDSPAGLAAWIAEKFQSWTDQDGELETAIELDWVLTNITP